ncbi:hypothetical protein EVAR_75320_1 [Eumeta japonica]|uniref:Uncharacterized protein n=1 Tax=Eumeta variegata TaxID=151549 RepID=A0A4C1XYM8_EUMVA|nr:hypothetical protein EVAR_75320_1 [Eumeta japonica]
MRRVGNGSELAKEAHRSDGGAAPPLIAIYVSHFAAQRGKAALFIEPAAGGPPPPAPRPEVRTLQMLSDAGACYCIFLLKSFRGSDNGAGSLEAPSSDPENGTGCENKSEIAIEIVTMSEGGIGSESGSMTGIEDGIRTLRTRSCEIEIGIGIVNGTAVISESKTKMR